MGLVRPTTRLTTLVASIAASATLLAGCTGGGGDEKSAQPAQAARPTVSERLGLQPGWGPSRAQLDRAARTVGRMSVPELAGQVIVARWSGAEAPTAMVDRLDLGGVIAFEGNVVSADQVRRTNAQLQQGVRRPWPLLVGVDQEGGLVERLTTGVTRFPAFMSAGAADRPALTEQAYAASGAELRRLGFNLDFAPDADVTAGPDDPVIGSRSAGSDPRVVAAQTVAAARGYLDGGVLPVVKHFPGHGSATTDSHLALPVLGRSRAELRATDLVPFRAAVDAGLPAVMIGHLVVDAIDPGVPATVSRPVIGGLLRADLGFDGVVSSDALEMGALDGVARPAVGFLRAGGDLVLLPPDPATTRASIVAAVRDGDLDRRRLEQAAARVGAMLLNHRTSAPRGRSAGPVDARGPARALSAAAVTVATGPCRGPLVSGPVVPMGDPGAVASFLAAAQLAGMPLGSVTEVRTPRPEPTGRKRADARALEEWRTTPPVTVVNGTPVRLGVTDGPGEGGVLVATDTPYLLGYADAPVEVATYGTTPGAMTALVQVLTGEARAPGRLPVAVDGVERRGC